MTPHRGFTLIEVMVALVLLALVISLSAAVFAGVTGAATLVGDGREAFDRGMNARRWLDRSLSSIEAGTPEAGGFVGETEGMAYASWEPVAGGWYERVHVRLAVQGTALTASINGLPLVLRDSVQRLTIDYLLTPGATSRWVEEWSSASHPPLAVRFRLVPFAAHDTIDTLLFLIRERG